MYSEVECTERHRKAFKESSGHAGAFIENLKLIAGTFEGSHRTKVHGASPLGPGQVHTERVNFSFGAVPSSSALTLVKFCGQT